MKIRFDSIPARLGVLWFVVDLREDDEWREQTRVPMELMLRSDEA